MLCAATASADGTLRLWDALTGAHVRVMTPHGGRPVVAVAFACFPGRLVTSSPEDAAAVWDTSGAALRRVALWPFAFRCSALAHDARGRLFGAGDYIGSVNVLRLEGAEGAEPHPVVTVERLFFAERRMWQSRLTARCYSCARVFVPVPSAAACAREHGRNIDACVCRARGGASVCVFVPFTLGGGRAPGGPVGLLC